MKSLSLVDQLIVTYKIILVLLQPNGSTFNQLIQLADIAGA